MGPSSSFSLQDLEPFRVFAPPPSFPGSPSSSNNTNNHSTIPQDDVAPLQAFPSGSPCMQPTQPSSFAGSNSAPPAILSATKVVTSITTINDKPKRPRTAYNLFFRDERQRLLTVLPVRAAGKPKKSHGKIGFEDMGRAIGSRWRNLDKAEKDHYKALAEADKARYQVEMRAYKAMETKKHTERLKLSSPSSGAVDRVSTMSDSALMPLLQPTPTPNRIQHGMMGFASLFFPPQERRQRQADMPDTPFSSLREDNIDNYNNSAGIISDHNIMAKPEDPESLGSLFRAFQ